MKQLHSLSEPTSQLLDDLQIRLQTDKDERLADGLGGIQSLCSVSFALAVVIAHIHEILPVAI